MRSRKPQISLIVTTLTNLLELLIIELDTQIIVKSVGAQV